MPEQKNGSKKKDAAKVKTLVEKAIRIYEQTLSTAQRVNAKNPYVQKTEEALERLRKLLL